MEARTTVLPASFSTLSSKGPIFSHSPSAYLDLLSTALVFSANLTISFFHFLSISPQTIYPMYYRILKEIKCLSCLHRAWFMYSVHTSYHCFNTRVISPKHNSNWLFSDQRLSMVFTKRKRPWYRRVGAVQWSSMRVIFLVSYWLKSWLCLQLLK